jgi:hypothetical protein
MRFIKYAIEIDSVAVGYKSGFINSDLGVQKLKEGYIDRQAGDSISLL